MSTWLRIYLRINFKFNLGQTRFHIWRNPRKLEQKVKKKKKKIKKKDKIK
jgi:hypothetical protein